MDGWGDSPRPFRGSRNPLNPSSWGNFHQDGLPQQLGRAVAGAVAGAAQSVGTTLVVGGIYPMDSMVFWGKRQVVLGSFRIRNGFWAFGQVECCVKSVSSGGYRWWEAI